MRYTAKDIEDFNQNGLYELFDNSDTLVENRTMLDSLPAEEKKTVATKMILGCPSEKMKDFGLAIKALASYVNDQEQETFYAVIREAHKVKSHILGLIDPENKNPHALFTDESLPALFKQFDVMVDELLETYEVLIAERLALVTPSAKATSVVRPIMNMFERESFSTTVAAAFTLKHNIQHLLGNNPERFFTSRDFNEKLCRKFPKLLEVLQGHEEEIALKLTQISSEQTQSTIKQCLRSLTSGIHDQISPFSLILKAMPQNKSLSIGDNPNSHFGSSVGKESNNITTSSEKSLAPH